MKCKFLIFIAPIISSLAFAQAPRGFDPESLFDGLDKDGDGKVAKSEANERQLQRWDQFDTNGDDLIDGEEQATAIASLKARFANGGFRGPGRDSIGGRPGGGQNPQARGRGSGRRGPPQRTISTPTDDAERVDRLMTLDTDGDNRIAPDEAGRQFVSLISRADTDGDGNASRSEIATMVSKR